MNWLALTNITLPLENPVLKFLIILAIILFVPLCLNRIRIPHLLGFIIMGAIVGPFGFNLMERDSGIQMLGTVGLLYILFQAGLEIDIADFKKSSLRSITFGLYTFIIPMTLGILTGLYVLNFSVLSSILLASLFASHTLITYPIVRTLGVTKDQSVVIAVGGTMITDTLALLVLSVVVGLSNGEVDNGFWTRLIVSFVIFSAVIIYIFPLIGRWFFKKVNDNVAQYIFVLSIVFLAGLLVEIAGIEPIIGAFMAGLAMNRLIPHTSPLMNRIDFVGNAFFIPFFLIGVGMLIDYRAFIKDFETITVAGVMIGVATASKFLAAFATQKTFHYNVDQRRLLFGLSTAQAAATLAAVLIGYNVILDYGPDGEPIRLLNDSVLNGSILMILITCIIASFSTQKGAQNIALASKKDDTDDPADSDRWQRILIPIKDSRSVEELVNLSVTIQTKSMPSYIYGMNVITNDSYDREADRKARKILEKAAICAAATDNEMEQLLRYDSDVPNAIISTLHEKKITDLILELNQNPEEFENMIPDQSIRRILAQDNITTLIYKPVQPLSTAQRFLVIVPERAEKELGFVLWIKKVWNIGKHTNTKLVFYAHGNTLEQIRVMHRQHPIEAEFHEFNDWDDFLILFREVQPNDIPMVVMSRRGWPSYHKNMASIPIYMGKYLEDNGFILIYPRQMGTTDFMNNETNNPSLLIS